MIINKKATHDYQILDKEIAGIMLYGSEVKALRENRASLVDAFILFNDNKTILKHCIIENPKSTASFHHIADRDRILLLTKNQIKKWSKELKIQGNTIIPLKIFFNDKNMVKVEIALVKGKHTYNKKQDIKDRDIKKQTDRELNA